MNSCAKRSFVLGQISLTSFLLGVTMFVVKFLSSFLLNLRILGVSGPVLVVSLGLAHFILQHIFFRVKYFGELFQSSWRAGFLGTLFGVGMIFASSTESFCTFGVYLMFLSFFHWSEYYVTSFTNPKSLHLESYMLTHSREYMLAAVASWVEYFIELLIFPQFKRFNLLTCVSLILLIGGEILRKAAMITASSNFNHYIQMKKQDDHELVTHGVYAYSRHPSYVGWFWWSIGTQVLLLNPLCLVLYICASWKFFKYRIEIEEILLLDFFGADYIKYKKEVGTGLPFIHGYRIS